jgi:hypothetical protein
MQNNDLHTVYVVQKSQTIFSTSLSTYNAVLNQLKEYP